MGAFKRVGFTALPVLAGLIAVAASVSAGPVPPAGPATPGAVDPAAPAAGADAGTAAVKPIRCEIQRSTSGGTMTLTPIVHADFAVTGSYKFRVTGNSRGGSSNIDQGGPFAAKGKEDVKLSSVSIGAGGSFDAVLTVTVNGSTLSCSEKAGSGAT